MITILLVILFLSFIVLVHELGHFFAAKLSKVKVEEFGLGYPPRIFGKKIGETTYSINAIPFGGFVKIYGEIPKELMEKSEGSPTQNEDEKDSARSFLTKPIWKRAGIMLAGVCMNVIFAWLILFIVFLVGSPKHLAINSVSPNSPAALAEIRSGDIVQSVTYGGTTLKDPVSSDAFIALVKEAKNNSIQIEIQGTIPRTVTIQGRLNPPEGEGALGIGLVDIGFSPQGFLGSLWEASRYTVEVLYLVVEGLVLFITKLFVSPKIIESITGPVGIFSFASQASVSGFIPFLHVIAFISLNIAVLNLLPFPALDGGRFLFLLIEKFKKRPVSYRIQSFINTAGFILLLVLMILVTIKDVGKLMGGS